MTGQQKDIGKEVGASGKGCLGASGAKARLDIMGIWGSVVPAYLEGTVLD